MKKRVGIIMAALLLGALTGCWDHNGSYCQSGPKYGTQCFSPTQVSDPAFQPYQGAGEADGPAKLGIGAQPR